MLGTLRRLVGVGLLVSLTAALAVAQVEIKPSWNRPLRAGEDLPYRIRKLEIDNQTHLTYRVFDAPNPRGIVLYLHGIQSHSGWFVRSSEILSDNGYVVYATDRRGSGLNDRDRGHLGDYEDLISDLEAFLARIRAEHPNLPIYLLGVSWGGKLALLYDIMRPGEVNGIILSTPGIKPRVDLSPWNKLKVFYYFWRRRDIQPEIPIPVGDSNMFTDSPTWQNWIEQDPLTLRRCTARFYWESRKIDKQIRKGRKKAKAPLLLLLAGRDEIIHNEKTQKFVTRKLTAIPSENIDVIEYPTARHTLEFEENADAITLDAVRWLDKWNPQNPSGRVQQPPTAAPAEQSLPAPIPEPPPDPRLTP